MVTLRPTEPYTPTQEAITLASQALESVSALVANPPETITFTILEPDLQGTKITIPGGMFRLMVDVLNAVSQGEPITLLPHSAELTTQEAADLLNVSRPYLVKLLDEGAMPSRKVGIYRRVKVQDVLQYQKQEKAKREKILDELTQEAQEMGLYDLR
ncbi:excisionase family DNA-binding protein [Gloeocapsa sp. PCC 73106]|uniref:excisionase family DNA-binding protein n=1 Tax=Gloeocapsa sp. PCC 73106 TaxID=102232 RepID=UPI0002ACACE6|nr:excisionase family DNA-binding protein [Gloeocapsa sp. PCC 73106]ELR99159.1 DNA-binding protein, excisionase family [Gloeocapsa sp. PCC 73106]